MLNDVFELIYKNNKWLFLFLHFFSALGLFSFISMAFSIVIEPGLALSMSFTTSIGSMLFTANKINDSKT